MAKVALVGGSLVLLVVVVFMVMRLLSVIEQNSIKGAEADEEIKAAFIVDRITPVGYVTAGAVSTEPVIRSGKEIVAATCTSCHGTGVMGAPKIGDTVAWAPRFAQGMPTLLKHSIDGFNGMPARGGDGSLSDVDVEKAIVHILEESGQVVSSEGETAVSIGTGVVLVGRVSAADETSASEEVMPEVTNAASEEVYEVACA